MGARTWQHLVFVNLRDLLFLESHGPDTYVGAGLAYPWGGLYGGHIVAQALAAVAATVVSGATPHSLRAYFIRRGDEHQPVRYEVDRIRDGSSFLTRRVVARQSQGAILNLEASFLRKPPGGPSGSAMPAPVGLEVPSRVTDDSWSELFQRQVVETVGPLAPPAGGGRSLAWMRIAEDLGDDPLLHCCALAYLSDDLPADAVRAAMPDIAADETNLFVASLDHTIWFHQPLRADRWHLHDLSGVAYTGGRGLSIGHLFGTDGIHAVTVAQEVLVRRSRV